MRIMDHLKPGEAEEQEAALFLKKKGLKLLASRFRSRLGEIDLIMEDKNTLVFVEVKYRSQTRYGCGAESVDFRKQNKLRNAALFYLQKEKMLEKKNCRFDVIDMSQGKVHWIKSAF